MDRFEIWDADLPETAGSPRPRHRPVLIVSDPHSSVTSPLITVVPLTTEPALHHVQSHVRLLNSPYRALCERLTTIASDQLIRRIGSVEDAYDRFALNRALANYLGLASAQAIYIQEDNLYEYFGYL